MSVVALPSSRLFDSDRLLGERTFHCTALPVFRPRQHWRECISKLAWRAQAKRTHGALARRCSPAELPAGNREERGGFRPRPGTVISCPPGRRGRSSTRSPSHPGAASRPRLGRPRRSRTPSDEARRWQGCRTPRSSLRARRHSRNDLQPHTLSRSSSGSTRPRAPGTFRRQTVRWRHESNSRRARRRPHPKPELLVAGDNPPQFLDRITRWSQAS
jgi:hypothetical protein